MLMVIKLMPMMLLPLTLCASPLYLKSHGTPVEPADLSDHTCIIDNNFRIGKKWPFISPDGNSSSIDVFARVSANSPRAVKEMTLAHGGIGLIPKFIAEDELNTGELIQLLPDYQTLEFELLAIYPHKKYLSRKVRCFIDFLIAEFSG
jgi:DNA-binding transcriptional LysR family regulator